MIDAKDRLEAAVALARRGFRVFPVCKNDKRPLIGKWQEQASSDESQIHGVWTYCPELNIGCFNDDLLSIDADASDGKKGVESLASLRAMHLDFPRTYTQATPRMGRHLTFRAPPEIVAALKTCSNAIDGFPGIDVRAGRTGYIVGAGSSLSAGDYTVLDDSPIADAPQWLIDLLPKVHDRKTKANAAGQPPLVQLDSETAIARATDWLEHHAPEAIEGTGGDGETLKVACRVKDFGISREKCLELMLDHWNETKASPPWDPDELAIKVANAYRYGQNAPGIASAEAEFDAVEIADRRGDTTPRLPGAWQQPADLWEQENAPDSIPADIVPRFVERFSRDRARRLGVDDGAMTAATITSLSSLVPAGNNLHMRQHSDSWPVKSVIWTVIIGDPGTAKSPAVNAAMVFPKAVEKLWREEFAKEKDRFELSQLADKGARLKRSAKSDADNPAAAPGQDEVAPPAEPFSDGDLVSSSPTEPRLRRKIVNDATTEALGGVLANCPDAAPILLHSDELAGIIGGMDAYRSRGSKDRPFFLSAKEGASFAIDRKSSGTTLVPALAIGILGTIQDDKLSKIAPTLTDDGFLQRFATVMIRKTGRGVDIPDDLNLDGSVSRVALELVGLEARDYRLAPDAAGELDAIEDFKANECDRFDISPALKTWVSKTPNEFGRYCLAFHLIEWATGLDPALGVLPESLVPRATAIRARRYVQEFLYAHAKYVYGTVMAKAQDDDDVRWVAGYILTRSLPTITAREIGRAYRSLRGSDKRAKLRAVMSTLAMQDWVKLTNETRGEWKVNPAVHDGRFRKVKESEVRRRDAVKAEIAATVENIRSAKGDG